MTNTYKFLDSDDKEWIVGEPCLAFSFEKIGVRVYRQTDRDIDELIKVFRAAGVTSGDEIDKEFWRKQTCSLAEPLSCDGSCIAGFHCEARGGGGFPIYCTCVPNDQPSSGVYDSSLSGDGEQTLFSSDQPGMDSFFRFCSTYIPNPTHNPTSARVVNAIESLNGIITHNSGLGFIHGQRGGSDIIILHDAVKRIYVIQVVGPDSPQLCTDLALELSKT